MRNSLMNPSATTGHWEPKYPFDLVIAYEDLATRNRAMQLYDHLARQLSDDFDLQCAWWKFEYLSDATLREQAVDDAASANMIVLSIHAGAQLPATVQNWIDGWTLGRAQGKGALVTLFTEPEARKSASPLLARLQQAARVSRLDFFANVSEAATDAAEFTAEQVAERARALTPTMEEILSHRIPVSRWGINES